MVYAEKRCGLWRARWVGPDGKLESESGFRTRREAEDYGGDQEAAIRAGTYVDPRAGRITLTEWVNVWYQALDLEPATLDFYRNMIEIHILPKFGDRSLVSLTAEEISTWETKIAASGYAPRTARSARSTLTTILADAVPRYIQVNPAQRKRRKGRKGQRRIERYERAQKVWATPLQALLVAERCAALSGNATDFLLVVTLAYTGMRWSEAIGLSPDFVDGDQVHVEWKLYELRGRFYRGRPKDGSVRPVDLPPFLDDLLAAHVGAQSEQVCSCRSEASPWCPGNRYVFLGPDGGHFRRSNYARRFLRPAADGWRPAGGSRDAAPVLVDAEVPFPGRPVPPWPAAQPGRSFAPRSGRGAPRIFSDAVTGRCSVCGRGVRRRADGNLIAHHWAGGRCEGSGQLPGEDVPVASWLPALHGLTPHGLRHGHQSWLEQAKLPYLLISERMGHEVPGMRGVYGHPTPDMRCEVKAVLQDLWERSLRERAQLSPRSNVQALDEILTHTPRQRHQDRLPFRSQNRTMKSSLSRTRNRFLQL